MTLITIPVARMYRVKADGTRYSKTTRVFRGAKLEDLLGVADEWNGKVEFADENDVTIDLLALTEDTPEEAEIAPETAEIAPETAEEPEPKTQAHPKPKRKEVDLEAMTKRISALMAKADSTDSPEEAQAFYAKAEQLMLQYAIDRASLEKGSKVEKEEVITVNVVFPHTRERFKALGVFGSSLLNDAIGLTGIAVNTRNYTITLYGRKADVAHARTIIEAAWRQAENHLRVWRKSSEAYAQVYAASDWPTYYRMLDGYVLGFCQGASAKIKEGREEFIQKTDGAELVLASVKKDVEDQLNKLPRSRARLPRTESEAYASGYTAGREANLVSELEGNTRGRKRG